jgi:hypothetical protein
MVRVAKHMKLLQVLAESQDPDGWVSVPYVTRVLWPELHGSDIRKCNRNLSCQLTYLKRRGVVTERRQDPYDGTRWIRLAPG